MEAFRPLWEFPWFGSVDEVLGEGFHSHGGEHFRAFAPNLAWKKQSLRRLEIAFVSATSCEVADTEETFEPRLVKYRSASRANSLRDSGVVPVLDDWARWARTSVGNCLMKSCRTKNPGSVRQGQA